MKNLISVFASLLLIPALSEAQTNIDEGVFTLEQASAGQAVYSRECVLCHGQVLAGTEGGPALAGRTVVDNWRGRSLAEFYSLTQQTMPLSKPAGLADGEYENVVAYILNRNGFRAGKKKLVGSNDALSQIDFANPANRTPQALLAEEKSGETVEWLHHRGNPGSQNYSALKLINAENVAQLEIAWRWRSDNFGPVSWPNLETTPLMANGVLYATAGIRRAVVAIDATSGETLWMYRIDEGKRVSRFRYM